MTSPPGQGREPDSATHAESLLIMLADEQRRLRDQWLLAMSDTADLYLRSPGLLAQIRSPDFLAYLTHSLDAFNAAQALWTLHWSHLLSIPLIPMPASPGESAADADAGARVCEEARTKRASSP